MAEQITRIWDQQPNEGSKPFAAFVMYREMPPYGDNSRSTEKVTKALGLAPSSSSMVREWSSKYEWQERVRAYDGFMLNRAITLKEVSQQQFASTVIQGTTARLAGLGRIVEKLMVKMEKDIDAEIAVEAGDLKRLVEMVKTIDDLGRRSAGLPTTFLSLPAEVAVDEEQEYIIGAGAKEPPPPRLEAGDDDE